MSGCAAISKKEDAACAATEDYQSCITSLVAQKEYESAERLTLHQEDYLLLKRQCVGGKFVFEKYPCDFGRKRAQRKTGLCIPRHRTELFECVNTQDFMDSLQRGFGY